MVRENITHRILVAGVRLVTLVVILFPIANILYFILDKTGNSTSGSVIYGTIVIVILHLMILYIFRESIIVNKQEEHLHFGNLVFSFTGIGLLVLVTIILKIAVDLLGSNNFFLTTVILFFCFSCDLFAAIIAFTILFLHSGRRKLK